MTTVEMAVTVVTSAATGGAVFLLARIEFSARISQLAASRDRSRVTLAAVREELAAEREAHEATRVRADELAASNAGLVANMDSLLQPARSGECHKIQLHTEDAARVFARKVTAEAGNGDMEPYRCDACPRQPATGERMWHIRHVRPTQRGRYWETPATPTSVRRRVTPEVIAQLKSRAASA